MKLFFRKLEKMGEQISLIRLYGGSRKIRSYGCSEDVLRKSTTSRISIRASCMSKWALLLLVLYYNLNTLLPYGSFRRKWHLWHHDLRLQDHKTLIRRTNPEHYFVFADRGKKKAVHGHFCCRSQIGIFDRSKRNSSGFASAISTNWVKSYCSFLKRSFKMIKRMVWPRRDHSFIIKNNDPCNSYLSLWSIKGERG